MPAQHYRGAQTQRSLVHFAIGPQTMPGAIIRALAMVKRACAEVNRDLGLLPTGLCSAIAAAAREIETGSLVAEFPSRVWQTGSGTQINMNFNEVIANRASEIVGAARGAKHPVHPNDHFNLGQSSNDCFPTAMHIAAVRQIKEGLGWHRAQRQTGHRRSFRGEGRGHDRAWVRPETMLAPDD